MMLDLPAHSMRRNLFTPCPCPDLNYNSKRKGMGKNDKIKTPGGCCILEMFNPKFYTEMNRVALQKVFLIVSCCISILLRNSKVLQCQKVIQSFWIEAMF